MEPTGNYPPTQPRIMADWSVSFFTKLHRYKNLLKRRWWVLALTVGLALAYQAYQLATAPPVYVSTSRMMVDPQIQVANSSTYREEQTNFYGTQIELMNSGTVQAEAHSRVKTLYPELPAAPVELSVIQKPNTSIFLFYTRGESPEYTQKYLDAVMQAFIQLKDDQRQTASEKTLTTITEQLIRLDKELGEAEGKLYDFQSKNNVSFWQEQNNTAASFLSNLNTELANMKQDLSLLDRLSLDQNLERTGAVATEGQTTEDSTSSTTAILAESTRSPYLDTKQEIRALTTQLAQLSEFLQDSHPKIIAINEEIERQNTYLEIAQKQGIAELKQRKESLLVRISNHEEQIQQWETKALEAGRLVAEFERLSADVARLKELRDRLRDITVNLDVSTSTSQVRISILEEASPAAQVKSGILRSILTGSMVGLLLGSGILFLLDRIDDRINSFSEFRDYFEEEVLGQVPFEVTETRAGRVPLLQPHDERQVYAESFRNIRSSLLYMATEGERPKVLLVTSAIPGEGKSTVAGNLARTLAFSGSRTLLVDADIRKGVLHEEFETEHEPGLAAVLEGAKHYADALCRTDLESLDLIPRGRPRGHIGELLIGPATPALLKQCQEDYEYIIIDSPPVLAADDTPSLAPKVDGVIMVMRTAFTSSRLTQTSLDQLRQRQARIVGMVLNCINTSLPDYYHYEYYRSYYQTPAQT